jgi:hypothetical protein
MTGVGVAVADINSAEFVEVRQRSVPKNDMCSAESYFGIDAHSWQIGLCRQF